MNNINQNKTTNISFGIAFKTYINSKGVKTADLIDNKEELKMYKNISNKLKKDVFIKRNESLVSADSRIETEKNSALNAFRYTDNTGNYYFANNKAMFGELLNAFTKSKKSIEDIFNK